jgi:hypothetical protein
VAVPTVDSCCRPSFTLAGSDLFSMPSGGFGDELRFGAQVALRKREIWPLTHTYAKNLEVFDQVGRSFCGSVGSADSAGAAAGGGGPNSRLKLEVGGGSDNGE